MTIRLDELVGATRVVELREGQLATSDVSPEQVGLERASDGAVGAGTPSARRTGTTCFIAAWCLGANMNPKPTASMQPVTSSGSRSRRAPSASSTSAEPH